MPKTLEVDRRDGMPPATREPPRRATRIIAVCAIVLVLTGCGSVAQLEDNTLDIGGSLGSLFTSQVLENLNRQDENPNAIPSMYSFQEGIITTSTSVTPSVSVPLGNTVTRTVAAGGVSQLVETPRGAGLQGNWLWNQNWKIVPQTDANVLRLLRIVYGHALGKTTADENDDRQYLIHIAKEKQLTPKKPRPAWADPGGGLPGTLSLADGIANFFEHCGDASGRCVKVMPNGQCISPNEARPRGTRWVCLGKHGGTFARLGSGNREMMMDENAFAQGALAELVFISLSAQHAAAEKKRPDTAN